MAKYLMSVMILLLGVLLGRWSERAEKRYEEKKYIKKFKPLCIEDKGIVRYFTWRGRDPVHLINIEEPPKQLLKFYSTLCDKLKEYPDMKPQFGKPGDFSGEIVYEISSDRRSKWRLRGGYNGASGDQELFLVSK